MHVRVVVIKKTPFAGVVEVYSDVPIAQHHEPPPHFSFTLP